MAKCLVCKTNIKPTKDDFIKLNKRYYHTICYKERELDKLIPIEIIDEIINNAKKDYQEEQEKKVKKYKSNNIRTGIKNLTDWIQSEYEITFLTKSFHLKMASIANGTYKELNEPITYVDLLDMLQRRKKQLDLKLATKKFNDGLHRFYYDLAVVLSQYDSYKRWKIIQENKKQEAIENLELQKRASESNDNRQQIRQVKKEESIEDILDDIFN